MTVLRLEQRNMLMECYVEGESTYSAATIAGVAHSTVVHYFEHFRRQCLPRRREVLAEKVPPAVLADRERRANLAPRDLVGWICGDPLPGYSALERGR